MSSSDSHTKLAGRALMVETPRLLLAALLPGDQAQVYGLYAAPRSCASWRGCRGPGLWPRRAS